MTDKERFLYFFNKPEAREVFPVVDISPSVDVVDSSIIHYILACNFPNKKISIESVSIFPLTGGLNSEVTGGGLYIVKPQGTIDNRTSTPAFVLKAIPSFYQQQENLFKHLDKLGQSAFVSLLEKYPSNQLALRELYSYVILSPHIPLDMPYLFFGVHDLKTEQSLLFLEDLSWFQNLQGFDRSKTLEILAEIVPQTARFHAVHWEDFQHLRQNNWLGNWWEEKDSDYVAADLADYVLRKLRLFHPNYLLASDMDFFEQTLNLQNDRLAMLTREPRTIIHWDYGVHNIMYNPLAKQGSSHFAVIDWQTTSIGWPEWDLVQLLMPIVGHDQNIVYYFLDKYLFSLPASIKETFSRDEFLRRFDLVVLEHFLRVCGSMFLVGPNINKENLLFAEWENCLDWIRSKFISLSLLKDLLER